VSLGLGTYALFWEWSDRAPDPIDLPGMLHRTRDLDADVFQICDYPALETYGDARLRDLRATAEDLGVELELGTRGTDPDHLRRYLRRCDRLGAHVLRSMVQVGPGKPGTDRVVSTLRDLRGDLDALEVDLALETYEQLPSTTLVDIVERADHPRIGIALDPANCVAALEHPDDVIDRCAPYTLDLHVKDFAFSRQAGWVGFSYAGAPMGEGLLDYAHELAAVRPVERGINQIVEHWLVWQGDPQTTIAEERRWTERTLTYARERIQP